MPIPFRHCERSEAIHAGSFSVIAKRSEAIHSPAGFVTGLPRFLYETSQ